MLTRTDDNSNTLFSEQYNQTYHSRFGAAAESKYVFLRGAGVYDRLLRRQPTNVLEIGFGLGLNFLLSADYAAAQGVDFRYTGIEHAPITEDLFRQLNYGQLLDNPELAERLASVFAQSRVRDKSHFTVEQHFPTATHLSLVLAEASKLSLPQLAPARQYDAIYLDAFSPDCNPECWTLPFFEQLREVLSASGRLATYCVKGEVRRNLRSAGFCVHKYAGPPGKREVLWADKGP